LQLAGREIIQEEKRRGPLHGDVVDAVIDQVFAYSSVAAGEEGDLDLGAHAVGRADQHGILPAGERVACAEGPDIGQYAAREGAARQLAYGRDGAIRLIDVDPGILVAHLWNSIYGTHSIAGGRVPGACCV
jgi:hypothetical protein